MMLDLILTINIHTHNYGSLFVILCILLFMLMDSLLRTMDGVRVSFGIFFSYDMTVFIYNLCLFCFTHIHRTYFSSYYNYTYILLYLIS